ncbi:hypothetical protein E4O00_08710 [Treponema sp. OMZ 788]|uniref:hypothetical protein n=1 Tax=Treponema sp. OMZ 788 TaxID=2563664 RepID=UPI0020A4C089|nr:hypothetical protein [Treponema sp. OMZ 788]UTC63628.1 hypothetical protein E4O00_08710 [Treponema sp. OMZ 788]
MKKKSKVRSSSAEVQFGLWLLKEERGSYQKALQTAKNLAEMGFTVEAIAKATGLSIEEVEAL